MNLLFICNHRGGANSLIPVIRYSLRSKHNCFILTTPLNSVFFKKLSVKVFIQNKKIDKQKSLKILNLTKPLCVVTGTSEITDKLVGRLEAQFIKTCKSINVPTLSILDFWTRYVQRFSLSENNLLDATPKCICVINETIKKEMINFNFKKDSIKVTGSPHLEEIKKNFKLKQLNIISTKKKYNIDKSFHIFTFISQPLSERKKNNKYYNHVDYDEINVVQDILETINKYIELNNIKNVILFIKVHPSEKKNKFKYLNKKFKKIRIIYLIDDQNFYEIAKISKFILSSFSMKIVELSYLGFKVLSYQPTNKKNLINLLGIMIINKKSKLLENFSNISISDLMLNKKISSTKIIYNLIKKISNA